ncbi:MAG: hypothetical protein KC493_15150 [Bacteriovoracaceae bacterium]|nr:hypothetical protein [Bacteriovoracaceae bacterium]
MKIVLLFLLFALSSCFSSSEKSDVSFKDRRNDVRGRVLITPKSPLSFKFLKKNILDRKCTSCHSPPDPDLDIDFSTYETTTEDRFVPILIKGKAEKSRLYKSVLSGEMPAQSSMLSSQEIEYIKRWINNCAPEFENDQADCLDDSDDDDDFGDDDFDDEPVEPTDDFNTDEF